MIGRTFPVMDAGSPGGSVGYGGIHHHPYPEALPAGLLAQMARRRPLLLAANAGFVVANTVTALSAIYVLTMAARFVGGFCAPVVDSFPAAQ